MLQLGWWFPTNYLVRGRKRETEKGKYINNNKIIKSKDYYILQTK